MSQDGPLPGPEASPGGALQAAGPGREGLPPAGDSPSAATPAAWGRLLVPEVPVAASHPAPRALSRTFGSLLEIALVIFLALFLALLLKVYVAEAYEIRGRSMETTFHEDDRVMVLKVFYEIRRGDIVIFSSMENPQKDLIKRVIGLPGDRVEMRNGEVLVNGEKLDEPYARTNTRRENRREPVLGPGQYYVLGDNRPDSQDSRVFHAIDTRSIKGKVILRWWPLEKIHSY